MRVFITTVLITLTSMTCLAGGIRIGDTQAGRIAKDASLPGKGKAGECLPFARALQKKFEAAGIPSRMVVYGYEQGGVPAISTDGELAAQPSGLGAARGSHAVVIYQDGGRTYVMDNQSWTPRWVHNATPMEMAQQFSGINNSVKVARVLPEEHTLKTPMHTGANSRLATR